MRAIVILSAAVLSGCAVAPHQALKELDPSNVKYASAECVQARRLALEYDDNVPSRMGIGLGLGLLLGPIGIPLAMLADSSQNDKRSAVVTEVSRSCR